MSDDFIPLTGLRGIIARRMQASVTTKPAVTLHATARAAALLAWRRSLQDAGVDVTINDLMIKTVAAALRRYPRMNGRATPEGVRLLPMVNVGFACSVPGGLTVPVIENADQKEIAVLAAERADKAERARLGKLKPPELLNGTFTVTNLGAAGVEFFTPIINPPELGILGIGSLREVVVWKDDRVGPAQVLGLSLSFDHAAIDGAEAAEFLRIVRDLIEHA